MQAKSRSGARSLYAGLILTVTLALGTVSGARAAVPLVMGPLPGGPAQPFQPAGSGNASVTRPSMFSFDASPPEVTLSQPKARSNDTMPSFSGTASDTTLITVDVYSGASAEGVPMSTLKVQGTGSNWVSAHVSPSLPDGDYTAIAIQEGSVGNLATASNAVTFEVDTQPPAVTLSGPSSRSNDRTPSFSGSASEATPVTVQIYQGARPEGVVVATVIAQGNRGTGPPATSTRSCPAAGTRTQRSQRRRAKSEIPPGAARRSLSSSTPNRRPSR